MRSVFQVVATMVAANAAVAYGADAKAAVSKAKAGAAATAADAKAKASDLKAGVKGQATDAKAAAKDAAGSAVKKVEERKESAPAPQASPGAAVTPIAAEAKEAVKDAMATQPKSPEELSGETKSLIIPESAVLPEKVLRFRAVYAGAQSEKGYDGAGNKVENGIEVKINAATAVFEYGITDKLSAQVLVPYRLDGKAAVKSDTNFATSGLNELIAEKVGEIKNRLGVLYANNAPAPQTIELLPGLVSIPAGAPVKTAFDQIVAQLTAVARNPAASPQTAAALQAFAKAEVEKQKFQEGLGDVEMGVKYALSTVREPWIDGIPFYTSVAIGVRLDSSKYTEATKKGERPVGRGTMDGAIRLNADYEILNGVQLQLENQTEIMLAKGKAWNYAETSGGKELDFERTGARQLGYSKLVVAPGTWVPAINFLVLNARYGWNNDSQTKLGDVEKGGSVGRSAQFGLGFDGLPLKLPVQLDYDYVLAARGRDVGNAFDANVVTLKLFYKF